jgi:CRISPR/Cas system-associated endoribonuclease Cas2
MRILRHSQEKMYLSISYDITDTKTRNKIVNVLESFWFRVQKSVFEIECNASQFKTLKKYLEVLLENADKIYGEDHSNVDSVKFYILSKVGEGDLSGRIDGLWKWYEKIYFQDVLIL